MTQHLQFNKSICLQQEHPSFEFFWKLPKSIDTEVLGNWVFCQWYPSSFTVDGTCYVTAEHYMMVQKARLFDDESIELEMLQEPDPYAVKKLGRKVQHFNEDMWNANKVRIVLEGTLHKFSQHPNLRAYLIATGHATLVEASPWDKIWGIGLEAHDERATQIDAWQGENLLGFILMDVRKRLSN